MQGKRYPTYSLAEIQEKVRSGAFIVTRTASDTAGDLGFDEGEIVRCVLALSRTEFYKSMASQSVLGEWQDVYRPVYDGIQLYVKLQISGVGVAVVISFKEL
jgi:motility quorum-sensing regulator/GCU-specific mRNA interferase toxin